MVDDKMKYLNVYVCTFSVLHVREYLLKEIHVTCGTSFLWVY